MGIESTSNVVTDDELMFLVASGDHAAFEILHDRWSSILRGFVVSSGLKVASADDIVQDVWIKVYMKSKSYKSKSDFKSWLFRIARNRLIDKYRRESIPGRHTVRIELDDERESFVSQYMAVTGDNLDRMILADESERILAVLNDPKTMPQEQSDVMALHIFCGRSLPEIAEMVGVSLPTCKSRYRLAREKICDALGIVTPAHVPQSSFGRSLLQMEIA